MLNTIYNEDCQIGIKRIPDNYVDLVIIDPPYLIKYKTNLSDIVYCYDNRFIVSFLVIIFSFIAYKAVKCID